MSETKTKPPASIDELATLHAQIGERLKGLKGLQERHDDKGGKKDDLQQLTPEQIGQMMRMAGFAHAGSGLPAIVPAAAAPVNPAGPRTHAPGWAHGVRYGRVRSLVASSSPFTTWFSGS